ncbi:MAG: hypothetical protein V3S24_23500, partial [Candidatus Tectomicrobia bacterium]
MQFNVARQRERHARPGRAAWAMLDLPETVAIKGEDGTLHEGIPTWRYWALEEGTLGVDPALQ